MKRRRQSKVTGYPSPEGKPAKGRGFWIRWGFAAVVLIALGGCGSESSATEESTGTMASANREPSQSLGSARPQEAQADAADGSLLAIADVSGAEQLSGVTLAEFKTYASDPGNTPLLSYARATFPGKYTEAIEDPQAVEYFVIANANEDPSTFWKLMEMKGFNKLTIRDELVQFHEWYSDRATEMMQLRQQSGLDIVDDQTIWAGQAAIIASALIAEQILKGPIELPEKSEPTVDERVQRILEVGFGDRADYTSYYETMYFAGLVGAELSQAEYPEEEFYPDFLQLGNKYTIGPLNGSLISGLNRYPRDSPVDDYFQMQ